MVLMQKANAGENTANAGRVKHVYALAYAMYALACVVTTLPVIVP